MVDRQVPVSRGLLKRQRPTVSGEALSILAIRSGCRTVWLTFGVGLLESFQ